jgi:hypothetical protein
VKPMNNAIYHLFTFYSHKFEVSFKIIIIIIILTCPHKMGEGRIRISDIRLMKRGLSRLSYLLEQKLLLNFDSIIIKKSH